MDYPAANLTIDTNRPTPYASAPEGAVTGNDISPRHSEMTTTPATKPADANENGPNLLIGPESRHWRRTLGPLAWAALEHLALAAQPVLSGWEAPVGARDVAAGLGVTKDTAARAMKALAAAGQITRTRVETHDGRHRSGYRLHPPVGLVLQFCQAYQDSAVHPVPANRLPSIAHDSICPANPDIAHFPEVAWPVAKPVRRGQPGRDRPSDTPSVQTTLFGRP